MDNGFVVIPILSYLPLLTLVLTILFAALVLFQLINMRILKCQIKMVNRFTKKKKKKKRRRKVVISLLSLMLILFWGNCSILVSRCFVLTMFTCMVPLIFLFYVIFYYKSNFLLIDSFKTNFQNKNFFFNTYVINMIVLNKLDNG